MIRLAVRVARADAASALAELLTFSPAGVEEIDDDPDTIEYVLYGASGELPSLHALKASVGDTLVDVRASEIADDWSSRWRSFHQPIEIAGTLYVRPPWHPPHGDGALLDIVIDPGQAFGTGSHATTRLCLEYLVSLAAAGEAHGALLDLGTGSGVLAIAAAKLGFAPVSGVDHEVESVAAARENAAANGVAVECSRLDLLATISLRANDHREPARPVAARSRTPPAHATGAADRLGLLTDQLDRGGRRIPARTGMAERAAPPRGRVVGAAPGRRCGRAYP